MRCSLVSEGRSTARLLAAVSIAAGIAALSVLMVPASLWAIRGPVDGGGWLSPAARMAVLWAVSGVGALAVVLCSRRPRTDPLLSRKVARVAAPWITTSLIAWFAFVYWLSFIGAGARGLTFAFAVVLSAPSILAPVAFIGLALRRRYWAWLLPTTVLAAAILLYVSYYREFFGR